MVGVFSPCDALRRKLNTTGMQWKPQRPSALDGILSDPGAHNLPGAVNGWIQGYNARPQWIATKGGFRLAICVSKTRPAMWCTRCHAGGGTTGQHRPTANSAQRRTRVTGAQAPTWACEQPRAGMPTIPPTGRNRTKSHASLGQPSKRPGRPRRLDRKLALRRPKRSYALPQDGSRAGIW